MESFAGGNWKSNWGCAHFWPWTASANRVKLVHVSKWRLNLAIKTLLIKNRCLFFFFYPEHAIWFYLVYLYNVNSNEDKSIQNKMPGKVLQAREPDKWLVLVDVTERVAWVSSFLILHPKWISPSSSPIQISLALFLSSDFETLYAHSKSSFWWSKGIQNCLY